MSWRQHSTRHQLYGHLPPITKTIQVRRTRHAGHCWRSQDELISDVLLWTPAYGEAKAGTAWTYIQQLCEDTGCSPEDLPKAMNDRENCWERVRDIRAGGTTWWWWYAPKDSEHYHLHQFLHTIFFFFYRGVYFYSIDCFSTQSLSDKLIFISFVNIVWLKHTSSYPSHILLKFADGWHFSPTKN